MPFLAPIGVALGTTVWGLTVGTWIAIGLTVGSLAYSYLTRPDEPTIPQLARAEAGLRLNTRSTQEIVRVVYGTMRVGGNDVFIGATGADQRYLWVVQTLSEGECDSIVDDGGVYQIWLGDKLISEFGSYASYWFHNGASDQTVDANLVAAFPGATDPYRNTCYIVYKLTFSQDYYQNLPLRNVLLKGKKLYDFRDESTAWSDNPVLAAYDYLTNEDYGCGIAADKIDTASWEEAADYADTKGFTINMALADNVAAIDHIRAILSLCRCALVWYAGKYFLRFADLNEEVSLMTLNDSHIVQAENGKAEISIAEPSKFNKPDAVRVRFIDAEKNYVEDDFVVGDAMGMMKQLDLMGCIDREMAGVLGVYNLERWQLDRTVTGKFRDDCVQLEPHDVVTVSSTALSISDQLMRVTEAAISADGLVGLTLQYESMDLYNDIYDLDVESEYVCTLPDPMAAPPSVRNVVVSEETYNYRLRTFTKLKVSFDAPLNYTWFSHVEIYLSYDDATWEHAFNSNTDFEIPNVEEGARYYLRLKSVNIWGAKQTDANDYKVNILIAGYTTAPSSLTSLSAIVNSNTVNLYASKVTAPDVELYEFRLGTSWTTGLFLGAFRSPNMSLYGVKPGSHTFWCNTLSNNGQYGATPRSATATLIGPPDGWVVTDTETIDSLVANGTMEDDSNWNNYGTPATNARSDEAKKSGTYSRKVLADGSDDGIKSDTFALVAGKQYGHSLYAYGIDKIGVAVRTADDSGWDQAGVRWGGEYGWTLTGNYFTATKSGSSAYLAIWDVFNKYTPFYIDDVCVVEGEYDESIPMLYNGDICFKRKVETFPPVLSATYKTPIYDRSSSDRYLIYVESDITVLGGGTDWQDVFTAGESWEDHFAAGTKWADMFSSMAAPKVSISLLYGDASPPTNEVEKLEIMSCIVTGRYFQVKITIDDPAPDTYALVGKPTIKFAQ